VSSPLFYRCTSSTVRAEVERGSTHLLLSTLAVPLRLLGIRHSPTFRTPARSPAFTDVRADQLC
jgi:hypothetical protein